MNHSVKQSQLEGYAHSFSQTVCRDAFATKTHISGQDLLVLTPVEQVNYFVLKVLYRTWQKETLRLESPYFNYQHASVHKALCTFMDTLSQHIYIAEKNLAPLLAQACQDTLQLLFEPKMFFQQELIERIDVLSDTYLRNTKKYLRINTQILSAFIEKFESTGQKTLPSQQAAILLNECEATFAYCDPVEHYVEKFGQVVPLPMSLLADRTSEPIEEESLGAHPQIPEASAGASFDIELSSHISPPIPSISAPSEADFLAKSVPPADSLPPSPPPSPSPSPDPNFSIPQAQSEDFIRILFNHKRHIFSQALQDVSRCTTFDDAVELLLRSYGKPQGWDLETTEVKELFKQVFLHFRKGSP